MSTATQERTALRDMIREQTEQNGAMTPSQVEEAIWNGHTVSEIAELIGESTLRAMLRQYVRQFYGEQRVTNRRLSLGVAGTATRAASAPDYWDDVHLLTDGAKRTCDLTRDDMLELAEKHDTAIRENTVWKDGWQATALVMKRHKAKVAGDLRAKGIDLPVYVA